VARTLQTAVAAPVRAKGVGGGVVRKLRSPDRAKAWVCAVILLVPSKEALASVPITVGEEEAVHGEGWIGTEGHAEHLFDVQDDAIHLGRAE
jgi:hypothetical protein